MAERLEPSPFEVPSGEVTLSGEEVGEGPPVVLLHGLTATRRYVLHGSVALARSGRRLVSYDARGHGESSPAAAGEDYGYPGLVRDLRAVIGDRTRDEKRVLAGHSMGCHTAVAFALERPDEVAALVLAGPVSLGLPPSQETLAHWDRLADGLESRGLDGFMDAYAADLEVAPEWRDTALRITRERMALHEHPEAMVRVLREVPRSLPFEGVSELETLSVPSLVVASHDDADPGHPYSVAEAWAQALPQGRLISEERGKSPLAWQGGRLSRVIADFLDQPRVAERVR